MKTPLVLFVALSLLMGPVTPANAQEAPPCRPEITNHACQVVIDLASPSSPLPLRARPAQTVTIHVKKRPLDVVTFKTSSKDVSVPSAGAAIVTAISPSLPSLVISRTFARAVQERTDTAQLLMMQKALAVAPTPSNPIEAALESVRLEQTAARLSLEAFAKALESVIGLIDTFNGGGQPKTEAEFTTRRDALASAITAGLAVPLPSAVIDITGRTIETQLKARASLTTPLPSDVDARIAALANEVVRTQATLESDLATLRSSERTVLTILAQLEELTFASAWMKAKSLQDNGRTPRQSEVTVSVRDLMTGEESSPAEVTVTWAYSRWETSSGLLFSDTRINEFSAAARYDNGQPIRVAEGLPDAGKVDQFVTHARSRPMVVPMALVHFNVGEGYMLGGRMALLGTVGIGVNPHSKSADYGWGGSIGVRSIYVTYLRHTTRDVRLTGGLIVDQSLGPQPPALSTERYWRTNHSLSVSVRVF